MKTASRKNVVAGNNLNTKNMQIEARFLSFFLPRKNHIFLTPSTDFRETVTPNLNLSNAKNQEISDFKR